MTVPILQGSTIKLLRRTLAERDLTAANWSAICRITLNQCRLHFYALKSVRGCFIADWERMPGARGKWVPVYRGGPGVDRAKPGPQTRAEKVAKHRAWVQRKRIEAAGADPIARLTVQPIKWVVIEGNRIEERTYHLLREIARRGGVTAYDLAPMLDMSLASARSTIQRMRRKKLVYVCDWRRRWPDAPVCSDNKMIVVINAGPGVDVPYPPQPRRATPIGPGSTYRVRLNAQRRAKYANKKQHETRSTA